jgi:hypothetical protein
MTLSEPHAPHPMPQVVGRKRQEMATLRTRLQEAGLTESMRNYIASLIKRLDKAVAIDEAGLKVRARTCIAQTAAHTVATQRQGVA